MILRGRDLPPKSPVKQKRKRQHNGKRALIFEEGTACLLDIERKCEPPAAACCCTMSLSVSSRLALVLQGHRFHLIARVLENPTYYKHPGLSRHEALLLYL